MAYFRKLDPKLAKLQELFNKNERWLILINADPDALASALA
jgi:nanoRNase/pAp phosphatase (c-di-AMP/oligoRNAs hydrolase)